MHKDNISASILRESNRVDFLLHAVQWFLIFFIVRNSPTQPTPKQKDHPARSLMKALNLMT